MPKPLDRVQLQKYETVASGGDAADEAAAEGYNTPLDADEDAPDVAGIYFQESPGVRDKTVTVYREGGELFLEDGLNAGGSRKSLTQLSSGALPTPDEAGQALVAATATAYEQVVPIIGPQGWLIGGGKLLVK